MRVTLFAMVDGERRELPRVRAGVLRCRADADDRVLRRLPVRDAGAARTAARGERRSRLCRRGRPATRSGAPAPGCIRPRLAPRRALHDAPSSTSCRPICRRARYGGPIVAVHGLCNALARARARGERLHDERRRRRTSRRPGRTTPVDLDGVQVHYFPSPLRAALLVAGDAACARARVQDYDVVHSHAVYLWPGIAAATRGAQGGRAVRDLAARHARAGADPPQEPPREDALAARCSSGATSRTRRRSTSPRSSNARTPTARRHAAAVAVRRRRTGSTSPRVRTSPRDDDTLVFLGRINWKKGLDARDRGAAGAAGRAARRSRATTRKTLTPRLRELAAARTASPIASTFLGPVYGAAKDELLARATLFVLPSTSENFGNAVLEALAMETPVVLSPDVGLAADVEVVARGRRADQRTLDARCGCCSAIPSAARRWDARGRALVESRFTWARVAEEMEEAYLLDQITPLILTRDEEPNIDRTLAQLGVGAATSSSSTASAPTPRSRSRAASRTCASSSAQIDTLAGQSELRHQQVRTPWVLALDADYFVPAAARRRAARARAAAGHARVLARVRLRRRRTAAARVALPAAHRAPPSRARARSGRTATPTASASTATTGTLRGEDRPRRPQDASRRFIERQRTLHAPGSGEAAQRRSAHAQPRRRRIRKLIVVAPFAVLVAHAVREGADPRRPGRAALHVGARSSRS